MVGVHIKIELAHLDDCCRRRTLLTAQRYDLPSPKRLFLAGVNFLAGNPLHTFRIVPSIGLLMRNCDGKVFARHFASESILQRQQHTTFAI